RHRDAARPRGAAGRSVRAHVRPGRGRGGVTGGRIVSDQATVNGDAAHYAIGEVLARLQGEFPDVTISKIRFLESQGLIAPERTASGYRVFYDADVQRLRWILHQQREYFLPLKVIKERLDEHGPGAPPSDEPAGAVSPAREKARRTPPREADV